MASEDGDDCLDSVEQEREKSRMTSSFWFDNAGRGPNLGGKMMRSLWDVCLELSLKHTNGEGKSTVGNMGVLLNLGSFSI